MPSDGIECLIIEVLEESIDSRLDVITLHGLPVCHSCRCGSTRVSDDVPVHETHLILLMNRWARALEVVEEVIEVQPYELLLSSRWRTLNDLALLAEVTLFL